MTALPESPNRRAIDIGVREQHGQVIAEIFRLQLAVLQVDRQFRRFDRQTELTEALKRRPDRLRGRQIGGEVRLDADAVQGVPGDDIARTSGGSADRVARGAVKQEYAAGGKPNVFARLEPALTGEVAPGIYADWAQELGMTHGAVKVALHRLRRRFGEVLRSEIAHTVSSPEEVDDEIRHLFAAIAR